MHKLIIRLAVVLLLSPVINVTQAATDLNVYRGKIDSVNLKSEKIVIDDSLLYLAPNYQVKNVKGDVISAFSLKKGRLLEYKLNAEDEITEIIVVK